MMIPDYALVAEVMLFSEGFTEARLLSGKMVKLVKLASEQLTQQVRDGLVGVSCLQLALHFVFTLSLC